MSYNENELYARVKELFNYCENTGSLTRTVRVNNQKAGTLVGKVSSKDGYMRVQIDGVKYLIHRIIWLWMYGKFPDSYIDHINHDRADNRLSNLREATHRSNSMNSSMSSNNTSGVTGVGWHNASNRWRAQIKVDYKTIDLGTYVEFSDAVNARKNAEVLYGFHENHGKDEI